MFLLIFVLFSVLSTAHTTDYTWRSEYDTERTLATEKCRWPSIDFRYVLQQLCWGSPVCHIWKHINYKLIIYCTLLSFTAHYFMWENYTLWHFFIAGRQGRDMSTRNLYLVCRMFWCDDVSRSNVCWGTFEPQFNFVQVFTNCFTMYDICYKLHFTQISVLL